MSEKKKLTTKETFALALQNHQKNNLQVAEKLYKEILYRNPAYVDVQNNLGLVFKQLGKHYEALDCYKNAILLNPNYKLAVNNLSMLLKEIQLSNLTQANSSNLKELVLLLFKRNDINHRDIFHSAKTLLFIEENNKQLREIRL